MADGTGTMPGRAGRNRKESRQHEKDEKEKEKRRQHRKEKEEKVDKGGIKCLPLVFMFLIIGPTVMGGVLVAGDFVADTSIGKSMAATCVDWGFCRTHEQQLTDLYMANNPKKVKEVPRLLRKWKGKEDKLIAEVSQKYEIKRMMEAKRKAAMDRDKANGYSDEDSKRGKSKDRQTKSKPKGPPSPPTPKAAGWDDEPAGGGDAPAWDDDEDDDADDIMADMMKEDSDL